MLEQRHFVTLDVTQRTINPDAQLEVVNCCDTQAQLKSWRAGCECQRKSWALCEGLGPLNPHCDGPSGLDLAHCDLLGAWLSLGLLSRSKSKVNDLLFSTFINWINNSDSCKLIF